MVQRRHVNAPRHTVYRAFVEPKDVAAWLPPPDTPISVHELEVSRNGSLRISLGYHHTFTGHFVEVFRNERIVLAIDGGMTIRIELRDAEGGTDVVVEHEDPAAAVLSTDENLWTSSLARLAEHVETGVRIVREFERRYKRQKIATVPFIAVLILGAITGLAYRLDILTRPVPLLGWTLFGTIVALGIFGAWNWRCPVCRGGLGRKLSPVVCRHCGVTLRQWP